MMGEVCHRKDLYYCKIYENSKIFVIYKKSYLMKIKHHKCKKILGEFRVNVFNILVMKPS